MGIFNDANEQARKANLKALEDKRVAFAQQLAREGFAPETMLLAMTENGGYVGICRDAGQYCLVISPGFGTVPPPARPAADTVWWGARKGREVTSG